MKKNSLFWIIGIIVVLVLIIFYLNSSFRKVIFDKEAFLEYNYTDDELESFANIAFPQGRIVKWKDNIKVEIADIDSLSADDIADVDSIIAIIAPLISPLTIERVAEGGNLIIHRKVEVTPLPGRLDVNPETRANKITKVNIYEVKYHVGTYELFRLFLEALGLGKWKQANDFYSVLEGKDLYYKGTEEEKEAYCSQKFPLAEKEKQMIRMLYNPEILPGLPRPFYMDRLGLTKK